MKILFVVHQFFPLHHTGTERLTLDLAKQLQRMGHYLCVLTYEPDVLFKKSLKNIIMRKSSDDFFQSNNYLMGKKYQFETIPVIAIKYKKNNNIFDIFDAKLENHLSSIVKEFDIVHFTHTNRLASALKCCKKFKIPTILTLTDPILLCPLNLVTKDRNLCSGPDQGKKCIEICKYDEKIFSRYKDAKFFFDNVDKVFSGSEFLRSTFFQNGWDREIFLNRHAVDYSYVNIQKEPKDLVFCFMGSFIWHKGLHVLFNAFKEIKNKNIKLKVYGKGNKIDPYVEHMNDLVKDDHRIEFCGTFDYKDFPNIMKEISVVIIPSVYQENFPLVMQMALAYGKPVIASKIGGMPESIKDGENGFLFEVGNSNNLSQIIQKILDEPNIIKKLKQNIIKPPRIEEEAFTYELAYKELVMDKK